MGVATAMGLYDAAFATRADPLQAKAHTDQSATSAVAPSPLLLGLLAYVLAAGWFVATCMAAHLPRVLEAAGATAGTAVFAGALVGPAQVTARLVEFGLMHRSHPITSARIAVTLHPLGAPAFAVFGAPAAVFALLHGAVGHVRAPVAAFAALIYLGVAVRRSQAG
jgi:hypothetical protein